MRDSLNCTYYIGDKQSRLLLLGAFYSICWAGISFFRQYNQLLISQRQSSSQICNTSKYFLAPEKSVLPMRQSLFNFSGSGKFCLAHGLKQLTRDVKNGVRILNLRSDVTYSLPLKSTNDVRRRSLCDVKCH